MSQSNATDTPETRPARKERFLPEVGHCYKAVIIKGREPGKFPVGRIETEPGRFSGLVIFVNCYDHEAVPGEFLTVQVTKSARNGRFAFADIVPD